MRHEFKFNEDFAFLIFIATFTAVIFLISGVAFLSAFLTGICLYIYLRFVYFLWSLVLRLIGHWGKPDA